MSGDERPDAAAEKSLRSGRYTVLRRLGAGAQGETYEARDHGVAPNAPNPDLVDAWKRYVDRTARGEPPNPHGLVAIKRFAVARAKSWKDVELAEREARTLASLDHPRLPRYVEHFEEDGVLYLVMEKIEGESLAAMRARKATLAAGEVERLLSDIADALRYLHGRSPPLVHRDIKPGNVIRRTDGSYALVDFGAVRDRLRPEGGSTVVGTFGYMAPEQFQGRATPTSDVYGLGATALTMLTGCDPEALPHAGLGIDVERAAPHAPRSIQRALAAMLEPDPDRRAATVEAAIALGRTSRGDGEPRASRPSTRVAAEVGRSSGSAPDPTQESPRELALRVRQERRAKRHQRRQARAARRARAVPWAPRIVAKLGLLVAWIVVGVTVGLVVPLVLAILSLLFGGALRRAARACFRAARRSQAALGRASSWLSGHRGELAEAAPRVRVGDDGDAIHARVRVDEGDPTESERELLEASEAGTLAEPRRRRAR